MNSGIFFYLSIYLFFFWGGGGGMEDPENGGRERDDPENGGMEMNLGKKKFFWGGSKLFPKIWQKYAKLLYFSLFFTEIWGRVKKKLGGQNFFGKNGGEETDYQKMGGVGMHGRRPHEPHSPPPQGLFGTLP